MPMPRSSYAPITPLIEEITQTIQPETILCYSYPPVREKPSGREKIQYHLMIIYNTADLNNHPSLDTIADRFLPDRQISTTVFQPEEIRVALKVGSPFIKAVYREGTLLYGKGLAPIPPPTPLEYIQFREAWAEHWNFHFHWAQRRHNAAARAIGGGFYEAALQFLRETVEATCIAAVYIYPHYRPSHHNLVGLLTFLKSLEPELMHVFPYHTEEEEELLVMLCKGNPKLHKPFPFQITRDRVIMLFARVRQLQILARKLFDSLNGPHFRMS